MATIPDICEFEVGADQVVLTTQTNGDSITIKGMRLGEDPAAALAYMINKTTNHLKVEITEV